MNLLHICSKSHIRDKMLMIACTIFVCESSTKLMVPLTRIYFSFGKKYFSIFWPLKIRETPFLGVLHGFFKHAYTHWRIVDRRSIWEISVLCTSNEKSIFFSRNFVRQYCNLQNDMLELHVALAKKNCTLVWKIYEIPPQNWGFP